MNMVLVSVYTDINIVLNSKNKYGHIYNYSYLFFKPINKIYILIPTFWKRKL
jgi:hypothetical protein